MSLITDMLIWVSNDDAAMERVNAWSREHGNGQAFNKLDLDQAGGHKCFTSDVWAMAGNYFHWDELILSMPTFGWRSPDSVVLLVDHEGDGVRVYRRGKNRLGDSQTIGTIDAVPWVAVDR